MLIIGVFANGKAFARKYANFEHFLYSPINHHLVVFFYFSYLVSFLERLPLSTNRRTITP